MKRRLPPCAPLFTPFCDICLPPPSSGGLGCGVHPCNSSFLFLPRLLLPCTFSRHFHRFIKFQSFKQPFLSVGRESPSQNGPRIGVFFFNPTSLAVGPLNQRHFSTSRYRLVWVWTPAAPPPPSWSPTTTCCKQTFHGPRLPYSTNSGLFPIFEFPILFFHLSEINPPQDYSPSPHLLRKKGFPRSLNKTFLFPSSTVQPGKASPFSYIQKPFWVTGPNWISFFLSHIHPNYRVIVPPTVIYFP